MVAWHCAGDRGPPAARCCAMLIQLCYESGSRDIICAGDSARIIIIMRESPLLSTLHASNNDTCHVFFINHIDIIE